MANYVFNDERNVSIGAAIFSLDAGETIVLGRQAFWTAESLNCLGLRLLGSGARVQIAGELYTNARAIQGAVGSNRVQVVESGIVWSSNEAAIYLDGARNDVQNAGHVSGSDGVRFSGSGNAISNEGTIYGTAVCGVVFGRGSGDDSVINSGAIGAYFGPGIGSSGNGTLTVTNTGRISSSNFEGISARDVLTAKIVNSGTIVGFNALDLSSGGDKVTNTGTITGAAFLNAGNDVFDTSGGVMFGAVFGSDGDDIIIGSASGDRLDGGAGDDELIGNAGNDVLTGGFGADEFDGGDGRDTADYRNTGVGITADLEAPSTNTSVALGDFYISIENLIGSDDPDRLFGDAERNMLRGEGDDDLLDGRGGADVLRGGNGDDTYVVDDRGDRVVELFGDGFDTVSTRVDFTLPDFVETLTLAGNAAIGGTGNALSNAITGNGAANSIDGGLGNDILTGGGGADVFRFTTALGASNQDIVDDFATGVDRIALSRAIFTEIGGGATLAAGRFVIGSAGAQDANDRVIYDPANGGLYYDPDGTGSAPQILFAGLDTGLALTAADFLLVG